MAAMFGILLDIGYACFLLATSPFWLYRLIRQGRYRTGWKDRLGFVRRRHSPQPAIWIHAVSVGEVNAMATLIGQLRRVLPQYELLISATTDTGYARARTLYGPSHRVFFFPWDFSFAQRRAFERLRPNLCILMELEVWYNFTATARARSVPVTVVNGRISSAKGFPRYRKIAFLARPMFRRLALVLAQEELYAERFRFLGVPAERVRVVGSLKYDTAPVDEQIAELDEPMRRLHLATEPLVWVAGSTGDREEAVILDSYAQLRGDKALAALRLVIVPRKPERFDEVARLIEQRGYRLLRYSRIKEGRHTTAEEDRRCVILGDTMGDLRQFYRQATVIFVGRSLVPMGGSDMIEAAALGKPVVIGPHTDNFAETVDILQASDAVRIVSNGQELTKAIRQILLYPAIAESLGRRARRVILSQQGATRRTVEAIAELLGYRLPDHDGGIATPIMPPSPADTAQTPEA
ncbi:MAG: 3-deoxy-D-manno-octulosonic acid transferase [Sedimentisphaerales bacterium]|nr:3-deoxy-D-manno-octulosonic acid transferase [Sedimentisphaerales bacterium]